MSVSVLFKGIKAKRLQSDAIVAELKKGLQKEGKEQRAILSQTTATWSGEKPEFESLTSVDADGVTIITGPTGSEKAVNKFVWLDKGTRIRWALMSSDWNSKTKSGSFRSGRGRGRVVIAGRRAMRRRNIQARPGIQARGWTEKLQKQRKRPFQSAMVKAMQTGAKKVYK